MLRNQVQLITYADSLGGTLRDVSTFLEQYIKTAIGGVHLLPFYPSSADRGFAPLTHLEVEPAFGNWDDVRMLAEKYDLVADLTVNHLSCESAFFQDFLEKGSASAFAPLFLDVETFLDRHEAELAAMDSVYRPRPTLPYSTYKLWDGTTKQLWTTFTNQQIDLDVESEVTRQLMLTFINHLMSQGVNLIRLDAVGYTVKRPWTSSFLIPETYDFMRWLRRSVPQTVQLLAEVHHEPGKQRELLESGGVDWVYDFSLPLLILHALYTGSNHNVLHWLRIRPNRMITTLDTHDGIGVVDVEGLMTHAEIDLTSAWVKQNGGVEALRANGKNSDALDVYQLNSTYYSAVGEDDDAYIVARAIQFFAPGIPHVYYVGLLAGCNDYEQFAMTNHGRDVNRHNYSWEEISEAMEQAVVARLLRLMKLRSHHPAFQGLFTLVESESHLLIMRWEFGTHFCEAIINLTDKSVRVDRTDLSTDEIVTEWY